jgi:hypothetical protein
MRIGVRRAARLPAAAAILIVIAGVGCGDNRADAGQNAAANKAEAARAGVNANAPTSRNSKPPVDPTK